MQPNRFMSTARRRWLMFHHKARRECTVNALTMATEYGWPHDLRQSFYEVSCALYWESDKLANRAAARAAGIPLSRILQGGA